MFKFARVHWFLHHLSNVFLNDFHLIYDYKYHNYVLYKNYRYTVSHCFIVCRTSRKCFRVMYFDKFNNLITYNSCRSAKDCAKLVQSLYFNSVTNNREY